jgi:FlaA1/EpsC-like NDP-sugar epimerase
VVPIFREQIARGGPLTITHPEVRRYFMTIPEAVQLVLQAASLGQGGEVFVLDMGAPIRIEDLAKDLIELSGLELGRDLDIVYTGLRPGEKLFEELTATGESYASTRYDKIVRMRNGEGGVDPRILRDAVQELLQLATRGSEVQMRDKLREIVPEYAADPDVGTGTS